MSAAARETGAYSAVTGDRTSTVDAAADGQALVGIVNYGPVKKNTREELVEFTNNTAAAVTFTVVLDTCTDGTLYDNEGDSGCSVTFTVGSGNSQFVDIEAAVTGTIPYSISASSGDFSLQTSETVDAESGNVKGAVLIDKPDKDNDFTADTTADSWDIKSVDVRDEDGDDDLDRVEFEVKEGGSGGTVVGSETYDTIPGDRWKPNGNPAITIGPDDNSYDVVSGQLYTLVVRAYDADGNFDSITLEATA